MYMLGFGQSGHMRVNGLDEGQVCVTIRKVNGPLGSEFLLTVTHTQLLRLLRSQLVSRLEIDSWAQLSHKHILSYAHFRSRSWASSRSFVYVPKKNSCRKVSKCRTIHEDWIEQGVERSSEFPFSRKELSDSIHSLVRRATVRNSRRIPALQI
jgi:hypothetical protein